MLDAVNVTGGRGGIDSDGFEECSQDLMTFLNFLGALTHGIGQYKTAISFALEQARAGQPLDHSAG